MVITKEELNKFYEDDRKYYFYHNDELNNATKNLKVKVEFEVECESSPFVGDGNTIAERIKGYVDNCLDAMDEFMRHWGDHSHCIDPIKVTITNVDTEEEQDITDEILGEEK